MNLHIISLIIGREYKTRVKKKSFILITFLGPVFFAAMCLLPSLIMIGAKEETKTIAVVDKSGLVMPALEDSKSLKYVDFSMLEVDSLKANMSEMGIDAVLSISALDENTKNLTAEAFSEKPLGVDATEVMSDRINSAVQDYRIASYGIEDLASIMKDVKPNIKLKSYTIDEQGKEAISESEVYMIVSMLLGMVIYMFIALFCGMVMSSVIEEKSSRVVEVLVSSVKSTELMFGKIIGVALVALTQFLLWILLTAGIVGIVGGIMGKDKLAGMTSDPTEMVQAMGVDAAQLDAAGVDVNAMAASASEDGLGAVLSTLGNLPLGKILISFIIFFVFGYLLYASLFAAIGSAVENEGDSQQLQMPLTIPLLLGFFIAFYAFKAPDSALVFWGSMIPFTSPIVMLARIPYGVATWELVLSIILLVATFVVCAWISARIYKVGILMFGKKSTWKDLFKWMKQK